MEALYRFVAAGDTGGFFYARPAEQGGSRMTHAQKMHPMAFRGRSSRIYPWQEKAAPHRQKLAMRQIGWFLVVLGWLCAAVPSAAQEGIIAGVKDLVDQIQDQTRDRVGLRVAVADFADLSGNPVQLGQYMAEEMTTQLIRRGVRVGERRLLAQVAEELRLNLSDIGLIDPASAQRLGQMLSVDAVIVGSLTQIQKTIRVHVKLIATETAEVVAGASTLLLDANELEGGMEVVPVRPQAAPSRVPTPASPPPPARPSGNLLTNGDFMQPWNVGWKRAIGNLEKGANAVKVEEHPHAGRMVHLRHVGKSYLALYQSVPVESVDLWFEVSFQARAWEGPIWGFSGAGTAAVRLIPAYAGMRRERSWERRTS